MRELGVAEDRIYLDHGLTGTNRARPGLDQALAALREGDTLVVPKLDRLARSVPDATRRSATTSQHAASNSPSAARSTTRPTRWARCSSTSSPPSPNSKSTSCGCAPAKEWPSPARKVGSRAGRPKLSTKQQTELRRMHGTGDYTITDLAELFNISRPTVYRTLQSQNFTPPTE